MADAEVRMALNHRDSTQAFYLAESGIEHALRKIKDDPNWREIKGLSATLGQGSYIVTCVDNPSDPGAIISSTGRVNQVRRTVEARGIFVSGTFKTKWYEK